MERTVARLRLDVQAELALRQRIDEAGFAVLDERRVDGEMLLVLERERAVHPWLALADSTRASYGADAVTGSHTAAEAEADIASLFPTLDAVVMPGDALTASHLEAHVASIDLGKRSLSPSNASVTSGRASLPRRSLSSAKLQPRQTKASALRKGGDEAAAALAGRPPAGPRTASTTSERARSTSGEPVAGYKRASLGVAVASAAAPQIAPRATKASLLRASGDSAPPQSARPAGPRVSLGTAERAKQSDAMRRRSIDVPVLSVRQPTTTPRLNRSALLRTTGASASSRTVSRASGLPAIAADVDEERDPASRFVGGACSCSSSSS